MTKRYLYKWVIASLAIAINACNLVNVTDVQPVHQEFEETVITSVPDAQAVLYGSYSLLKTPEYWSYLPGNNGLLGLSMKPGTSAGRSEQAFFENNVPPDNSQIDQIYTHSYKLLFNLAQLIQKTEALKTEDTRKTEILGEARFLRALAHFNLLRSFGQFFKPTSKYGVVLRSEPPKEIKPEKRADVKTVYDNILVDLQYAAENAPDMTDSASKTRIVFFASRYAALALKARVHLYNRQYGEAAAAAEAVIKSGRYALEAEYSDIFSKKIIGTKETIFQTPFDDKQDRNNKAFMFRSYYLPSDYYVALMKSDKRYNVAITYTATGLVRNNKFNGSTYNNSPLTADTEYFLRLDEMYLILAEAKTRLDQTDDALKALNVIRKRARMPEITITAKAALLEAIRVEKILELGAESGEEWFDLIRYAAEGNLKVSDHKPNVLTETRYILPLPFETVRLSNGVTEQNPGY